MRRQARPGPGPVDQLSPAGYPTSRPRSTSATTTVVPASMVVPGKRDTAYHSSPREKTDPGWWLSETGFFTTAVSPIIPDTPFNIALSVSDAESEHHPFDP